MTIGRISAIAVILAFALMFALTGFGPSHQTEELIAQVQDAAVDRRKEAVRRLGEELDASKPRDEQTREMAAKAVKALIPVLKDIREDVRILTIEALGRIAHADGAEPLVEMLKYKRPELKADAPPSPPVAPPPASKKGAPKKATDFALPEGELDEEWKLRQKTAEALGRIAAPSSIPHLLEAMEKDPSTAVAMAAATALGRYGAAVVDPLVQRLDHRRDLVRQAAALGLGLAGDKRACEFLRKLLKDPAPLTRLAAAEALIRLKDLDSAPALAALMSDASDTVRYGIRRAIPRLGTAIVPPLVEMVEKGPPENRADLVQLLAELGDPRAIPALVVALSGKDDRARDIAEAALNKKMPKDKLYEALLAALDHADPAVRACALDLIGKHADAKAVPKLIEKLKDESAPVRLAAVRLLVKLKAASAADALAALLAGQPNDIRNAVAMALAGFNDPRGNDVLAPILEKAAAEAKAGKGVAGDVDDIALALGRTKEKRAVEPLLVLLSAPDRRIAGVAARALGMIGDPRATEPLLKILTDWAEKKGDNNVDFIRGVAIGLGRLGDKRAYDPLFQLLWSGGVDRRGGERWDIGNAMAGAEALGYLKDPRGFDEVVKAAKKVHYQHRWLRELCFDAMVRIDRDRAVVALGEALLWAEGFNIHQFTYVSNILGNLGDPRAIEPLLELLKSDLPEPRLAAGDAIKKIGAKGVPVMVKLLANEDPVKRSLAATALSEVGAVAVEPLLSGLGDPSPVVRQGAAWALGQINDPRAAAPLLKMLGDADLDARSAAAWALGQMKEKSAVDPLIAMAKQGEEKARCGAVQALGEIADPRGLEPVADALRNAKEPSIRAAAAKSLSQIGGPRAKEILLASRRDGHEDVREAIREAINSFAKDEEKKDGAPEAKSEVKKEGQ